MLESVSIKQPLLNRFCLLINEMVKYAGTTILDMIDTSTTYTIYAKCTTHKETAMMLYYKISYP